jgi:hypothetical protein
MSILNGKTTTHELLRERAIQLLSWPRHPDEYIISDLHHLNLLHDRVVKLGGYMGLDPDMALPLIALLVRNCIVFVDGDGSRRLVFRVQIPKGITSEYLQDRLDLLRSDESTLMKD